MGKIHFSVYMAITFLLLCSITWVQSETMRSRAAVRAAFETEERIDKMFLESDAEKQRELQKQSSPETWNLPEAEEEKAYMESLKDSRSEIIDSLNDELEVDTFDYMKDDPDYDSDDGLNDGRYDDW